jgi:hypothetical protein
MRPGVLRFVTTELIPVPHPLDRLAGANEMTGGIAMRVEGVSGSDPLPAAPPLGGAGAHVIASARLIDGDTPQPLGTDAPRVLEIA